MDKIKLDLFNLKSKEDLLKVHQFFIESIKNGSTTINLQIANIFIFEVALCVGVILVYLILRLIVFLIIGVCLVIPYILNPI